MRVVINFQIPIEPFNTLVREGRAGAAMHSILEEIRPEAAYFYAPQGCRGGTLVVDVEEAWRIPSICEPLFLKFGARCEVHPAMTAQDLEKAGLEGLGEKWG